jgi:serine/threonine-protein kinase
MDNTYFIVMEYVRGTDLKTAIQQRGAINQRKVAEIGSQVCAALSVAHSYDIIHRDIKPHNIMVQPDGNAKVMDFGIARANGSTMTQTGSVLGTAYYVSPEQAQGKPLTPATDLYSLGVVLYEATTGRVPFDAPDAVAVALKQVNELPVPPTRINPDIDPALESIILRALAKNPLERYATAEQMRVALNNYLAGRPVDAGVEQPAAATRVMGAATALPVISSDGAQPPAHTAVMPSVGSSQQPLNVRSAARAKEEEAKRKKKRAIIIASIAAVICIALIGIGVYIFLSNDRELVEVPNVAGLTEQEARDKLKEVGLEVGKVTPKASPDVEKDRVIETDPSARTTVDKGSTVDLVISSGPEEPTLVEVPNLRDSTPELARTTLEGLKLNYINGGERTDPDVAAGKICAQEPEAGEMVAEGQAVTFYVSKGKATGVVPNVVGETEENAVSYLKGAGFEVAWADAEYSDDYLAGLVMRQTPTSGSTQDAGSTVTITLSQGPKPVTVPDLTGETLGSAMSKLQDLDLKIKSETRETTDATLIDKVVAQDPAANASVTKGSTVTVYIGVIPA